MTSRMVFPEGKLLYRNGEARALLGIGNTKLFELIKDGYLESVPMGLRGRRITRESIERLVSGGMPPSRRPTPAAAKAAKVSPPANNTDTNTDNQ